MAVLAIVLVASSGPLYKSIAGRKRPVSETPLYNPGTYTGSARGYGGNVTVTIEVSEYAIEEVRIEAPNETPEIGKAAAVQMQKTIWSSNSHSVDSISGATMTSNAIKKAMSLCFREAAKEGTELYKIIAAEEAQENDQVALPEVEAMLKEIPDGTYTYQDEAPDGDGYYNKITVTVMDHKLMDVVWDVVDEQGTGKRELSANGSYVMTENGPLWYEQADALSQYVIERQTTAGLMNEGGTTDEVASVSIHIGGFVDTLKRCLLVAKGDLSQAGINDLLKHTPDGSYHYLSETADENGFRDQIEMTVKDHAITALTWDAVKEDGSGKRLLSSEGNYVMTENGPLWYEQADALADYVVEHQTTAKLLDEEGRASDAVSSVSIYAGGFADAVKKCLQTANGDVSNVTVEGLLRGKADGTYTYVSSTPDDKGFRDQVTVTVKDHKLTDLTWDAVGEDGTGKRKLSEDGAYVMTEKGPLWYEQADALAGYLMDHQSEEGMLDDSGYASDAVASVSIYAGGFLDAVKKCLVLGTLK